MSIRKQEVLRLLTAHKNEMEQRFGVSRIGLVGSVARDEASARSDVDIIVSLQSKNKFRSFFDLLYFLEDQLQCKVDLATEASLKDRVKKSVMKDVHYV